MANQYLPSSIRKLIAKQKTLAEDTKVDGRFNGQFSWDKKNNHFHDYLNNANLINGALLETNKEWWSILHSEKTFLGRGWCWIRSTGVTAWTKTGRFVCFCLIFTALSKTNCLMRTSSWKKSSVSISFFKVNNGSARALSKKLFKVNNEASYTWTTPMVLFWDLYCYLWRNVTNCFSVSTVDLEWISAESICLHVHYLWRILTVRKRYLKEKEIALITSL